MSVAKGELSINVPTKRIDWEVFRVGHVRVISNNEDGLKMRLLLDDESGNEIGFVNIIADKDLVFGL